MTTEAVGAADLKATPLKALHQSLDAKLVGFAGFAMPLHYPTGILAEHHQVRTQAGLFDVSHMGQFVLSGGDPATALEALIPGDIRALIEGGIRYSMLTDDNGGILDDIMVAKDGDRLSLVVNAGRRDADLAHLKAKLAAPTTVEDLTSKALLALQGPAAAAVMARLAPQAVVLRFMAFKAMEVAGIPCVVSRSGYTGEDGFEISVAATDAEALARRLLVEPEVRPIGLGARDSLRLEAGLCLHGADIDRGTTPIEAGLNWTISNRRRRDGGFPGADIILRQLSDGPQRMRVGIKPLDKAPARGGTPIIDSTGRTIGTITSGGFGPTAGGPVAMGYVEVAAAIPGTPVKVVVRGTPRDAKVMALPFVPHRYCRG
jgi:aminomethyltransferase